LKDTVTRFLPYWSEVFAPSLRAGGRSIIAAHGNTSPALVKYVDGISDADIPELEIPTGIPLVYELDENLRHWRVIIWETPRLSHKLRRPLTMLFETLQACRNRRTRASCQQLDSIGSFPCEDRKLPLILTNKTIVSYY
jgi:hypothetical protein